MKVLTRKQANKLYGHADSKTYSILRNGQVGYCWETKTVITCCGNCGDYVYIDLDDGEPKNG